MKSTSPEEVMCFKKNVCGKKNVVSYKLLKHMQKNEIKEILSLLTKKSCKFEKYLKK